MRSNSHEFFGRANGGLSVPQFFTHLRYSPRYLGVCQVFAIPGQQIVNPVNRRHSDLCGIKESEGRKHARCHDGVRQRLGVLGGIQRR